jgi:hypothetical protein
MAACCKNSKWDDVVYLCVLASGRTTANQLLSLCDASIGRMDLLCTAGYCLHRPIIFLYVEGLSEREISIYYFYQFVFTSKWERVQLRFHSSANIAAKSVLGLRPSFNEK